MKIFITGGARSGKSRYSQKLAESMTDFPLLIATAYPTDEEMKRRIEMHKKDRNENWETIEEPLDISLSIKNLDKNKHHVVVIDCLTVWLSNLFLFYNEDIEKIRSKTDEFIKTAKDLTFDFIMISNEVGMGIVPENKLARSFRDELGLFNQKLASISDEVILIVAGIPLIIKGRKG